MVGCERSGGARCRPAVTGGDLIPPGAAPHRSGSDESVFGAAAAMPVQDDPSPTSRSALVLVQLTATVSVW